MNPERYYSEKNGVRLVSIGKVHEAGESRCLSMGMLGKGVPCRNPGVCYNAIIVDTEASIEHFGRGLMPGPILSLWLLSTHSSLSNLRRGCLGCLHFRLYATRRRAGREVDSQL